MSPENYQGTIEGPLERELREGLGLSLEDWTNADHDDVSSSIGVIAAEAPSINEHLADRQRSQEAGNPMPLASWHMAEAIVQRAIAEADEKVSPHDRFGIGTGTTRQRADSILNNLKPFMTMRAERTIQPQAVPQPVKSERHGPITL